MFITFDLVIQALGPSSLGQLQALATRVVSCPFREAYNPLQIPRIVCRGCPGPRDFSPLFR